jgi:translation initiation factor IF-3
LRREKSPLQARRCASGEIGTHGPPAASQARGLQEPWGARIFFSHTPRVSSRRNLAKKIRNWAAPAAPRRAPYQRPAIDLKNIRVNNRIRARDVRVIMGSTGQQLGVMKLSDALRQAQSLGLDLVEVAPQAVPPVCRIVDYGKFKYEASKQEKASKNAGSKLKEIKFRVNISTHDYETKLRHGEEFLDKGNKVRVQLQFRGREMAHQELGMQLMTKIKGDLATMANVEMEPKQQGRNITMTLAPLPASKRKRQFASDKDLPPLEDEPDEPDEEGDEEE